MLKERLQILINPDQRRRLEMEAKRRGTSVASLIREAVDSHFGAVTHADRMHALDEIRTMKATFLPPDELGRISEEEREDELKAVLRSSRP